MKHQNSINKVKGLTRFIKFNNDYIQNKTEFNQSPKESALKSVGINKNDRNLVIFPSHATLWWNRFIGARHHQRELEFIDCKLKVQLLTSRKKVKLFTKKRTDTNTRESTREYMRERKRQSGLGRYDGRHKATMFVIHCPVISDHLPKEKPNKTT